MDTIFLNLVRGNRLSAYMGLEMDPGVPYRFAKDYTYVEIPLGQLYNMTEEEVVDKVSANQKIRVIPACRVNVRANHKLLVKVNPKLQEVATCPPMLILDADEQEQPSFVAHFHRAFEAKKLDWAVRLYMIG